MSRLHLVSAGQALRAGTAALPGGILQRDRRRHGACSLPTIELAPDAPLLKRLDIRAPWLDEIRIDQRERFTGGVLTFKPRRQGQLETDGSGEIVMAAANELLLPALLAMDVYHRDVAGGQFSRRVG